MQNNERINQMPERLQQLLKVKQKSSQIETQMLKSDTYFTPIRGKGMDSKEVDRKTIIDIIAELQEKEKGNFVKCLDIEREAMSRGISKPTFYRRLTDMAKEGILEKLEVSRKKDTRYRVNFRYLPEGQAKVLLFKRGALMKINEHMDQVAKKNDEQEIVKELGKKIGALGLYSLLKTIETGLPYMDAVMYYLTQPGGAPKYLRHIAVFKSGVILDPLKDSGKMIKLLTDAPLGNDVYAQKVQDLFEMARDKFYPLEFDEFNLIVEESVSGKPAYEPAEETKALIEASMRTGDEKPKKKPRPKGRFYSDSKYGPDNLKTESDSRKNPEREGQGKTEE